MIPLIVKSSRTRCYLSFFLFFFFFFAMIVVVVGASFGVVLVADLEWGPLLVGRGVVLLHC